MNKTSDMICDKLARREMISAHSTLNGIDYIEVPKDDQQNIRVYFIKPTPPLLTVSQVQVKGGVRIRNIRVETLLTKTDANSNPYLEVHVDQAGDFSTYTLIIDNPQVVDIAFSRHPFSFKAGCPSDFDCQKEIVCPTQRPKAPVIDYLAKDYASFRQALLDLIPTLIPNWKERHEADLGITLVELLAYVGDQLSYYQDTVANEAYLETARQRESVMRHAGLIDYKMHNGANAKTFIQIQVKGGSGTIPAGTAVITRLNVPLGSAMMPPHGPEIPNSVGTQALSEADVVFETVEKAYVHAELNEIKLHSWENSLCCLPRGTTSCHLIGDLPLKEGDFVLFEEVKGPKTDHTADADPEHRQVVRLVDVKKAEDPLQKDPATNTFPMKLTHVTWHISDALTFPLCLSSQRDDGTVEYDVSVAGGNLVLADHGQTVKEWHPVDPKAVRGAPGIRKTNIAYRFELKRGPMTYSMPAQKDDEEKPSVNEMSALDPRKTRAYAALEVQKDESKPRQWNVVPHLLDSNPFDRHFVVETRNDGKAIVRFGDGKYGMQPPDGSHIKVTYRVGNGAAGNVGAESLVHIVQPSESFPANWPKIKDVRNPLLAWGGTEPEKIEQVKLLAPKAFHAEQFRAVTEDDYAKAAEKHPEVDKAVATFRWTGSWHTVFINIDPKGRTDITKDLEARVRFHISRYKLAGYDIEIDAPRYVPLEIEMNICVARDHFRAHVKEAVWEALSNRELQDSQKGFFHPDNFTFGQALYLSEIYAAVEKVDGVDSAEVKRFICLHESDPEPNRPTTKRNMDRGYISMERLEIARLDNDPNFPENGILRLNMWGGK